MWMRQQRPSDDAFVDERRSSSRIRRDVFSPWSPWNEASNEASVSSTRAFDLRIGALVSGVYRVVRWIGEGGMGLVALAHDERLDRHVAVKFIRPAVNAHDDLRAFFHEEARAMARVRHPNVVTVHAFGEHAGLPFFVMDHVDGRSVDAWLASWGDAPPDVREAMRILRHACAGTSAIHRSRTVHRDLKPSNLLMDRDGNVAVADLGVARSFLRPDDASGTPGVLVGSAAYLAPEAALGQDATLELAIRRDVYALGCIAYELLAGRPPFEAPSDMGLMAKHMLEEPPAISSRRPDLPPSFDDVLQRALTKDPWIRFGSADELWAALARTWTRDGGAESA